MTPRTTTSLRTALLRVATGLVLAGLLAGTTVVLGGAGTPAVANTTSTSPLTVAATGTYAGLEVTVSQSRDLINQAVTVSWKGGRPTSPVGGFGAGFLQIMQCWADDGAQPTREQCQFGGNPGDARAVGGFLSSRQVSYGSTLVDPLETYRQPSQFVQAYVPFRSVTGDLAGVDTASNEFFDASTTNELAFGRTRADGTGVEVFETQTLREAPNLVFAMNGHNHGFRIGQLYGDGITHVNSDAFSERHYMIVTVWGDKKFRIKRVAF